jgi:RecJ-like exonuclease
MNTVFIDSGSTLRSAPLGYDEPGLPLPCPEDCNSDFDLERPESERCKMCEGHGMVLLCIGCREPMPQQHLPVCAGCRCDDDVSDEDSITVLDAIADFDRYASIDDAIDSEVFRFSSEDDMFTEVFDY